MICSKCGQDFDKYSNKAYICRDCKRKYDNDYHAKRSEKSKTRKLELQRQRRIENSKKLYALLSESRCENCGESDPVVLEFDHILQDGKRKAIAEMMSCSWKTILGEIQKCRILCSNCHRRHTAKQMGWYSFLE